MLRRRKVLEEGYNCVMCQYNVEETIEHLSLIVPLRFADGLPLVLFGRRT
jgi:hypothetical protein